MFQSEALQEKWAPVLDYDGLDKIEDSHKRAVTAVLLENQEQFLREQTAFSSGMLTETPTNAGNAAGAGGGRHRPRAKQRPEPRLLRRGRISSAHGSSR